MSKSNPLLFKPRTAPRQRISHRPGDRQDDLTWFYPAPERGGSNVCTCRVGVDVDAQVEYIISQHLGPWRTKSEFLRSAAGMLVRMVAEEGDDSRLFESVRRTEMAFDAQRVDILIARHDNYFENALRQAKAMYDSGERVPARTFLRGFMADTKNSPAAAFRRARSRFWHRPEVKAIMGASWNGGGE
jgi:hypothetical protein